MPHDEEILQQCPNLKWVGIIATGTDNLDLEACRRHGVAVANVPGYSTYSVAQMTFSLLLAICQCAERYNRAVKQGCWQLDIPESIGLLPQMELYGKTYGVYGYGSIGRQSARIARAFGMEVLVCTRTVRPEYAADGVEFVDYDTLLRRCDILSLHCPATPQTRDLVNAEALAKMKPGAILLNTAGARWWMRRPWQRPSTAVSWAFTGLMPLSPSHCPRKVPAGRTPRYPHTAHCVDDPGGFAEPDGHYHPEPAHLAGRKRRAHRQQIKRRDESCRQPFTTNF